MKKLAIAFAGLAAIGFSGAAFAEEATTGPAAMTDAEMDGVTAAGATIDNLPGPNVVIGLPPKANANARTSNRPNFHAGNNPSNRTE